MIVKFKTSKSDPLEEWDRKVELEVWEKSGLTNSYPLDFVTKGDYLAEVYLDMSTVLDFEVGEVYHNGQRFPCVYPRVLGGAYLRNLMISGPQFEKIFCGIKGITVQNAEAWK